MSDEGLKRTLEEVINLAYAEKPDAIKIINAVSRAVLEERDRCVQVVEVERELEGPMPDENWVMAQRVNLEEHLRATVRTVKKNVIARIVIPGGPKT